MKVGIVSDIHANSDALSEVAAELKALGIETLLVAGDTVGYYYNINLVREILSQFEIYEVRGNHEDQILSEDESKWREYEEKYGSGLRRNRLDLEQAGLNYIRTLQHPISMKILNRKITIAHGSPRNVSEYLYQNSDEATWGEVLEIDTDILVLGHTHHQMIKKFNGKLIINPGSVGQNRSAKSIADWAILDLISMSVEFKSTRYRSEPLIAQCEKFDPGLEILTRHLTEAAK
jgi:putative phosphoesterase